MRSLIACLQISENHGLLKRFGTAKVIGIVCFAMSFKLEVNKDMGSSASFIVGSTYDMTPQALHEIVLWSFTKDIEWRGTYLKLVEIGPLQWV